MNDDLTPYLVLEPIQLHLLILVSNLSSTPHRLASRNSKPRTCQQPPSSTAVSTSGIMDLQAGGSSDSDKDQAMLQTLMLFEL